MTGAAEHEQSDVPLDVSPRVNAMAKLREGLGRHRREPHDEQNRDGLQQRLP
jgi:hypothetical protein